MGIVATLSRIKPDRFEQMLKDNKFPHGYESENAYIDKCWEIIAYTLVGKHGPQDDELLAEVIFPKNRVNTYQDEHYTEGYNYSNPDRVKEINEQLKFITEAAFIELFEKRPYDANAIYPFWNKSDIDRQYLIDNFNPIKKIFEEAAANDEYMAIVIGD